LKAQNSLYAPYQWLDDRTFLTKAAEVVRFYKLDGIDFECSTDEQMESRHHRIQTAILSMPEEIRVKFYWRKMDRVSIPRQEHSNPVVRTTIQDRAEFLENRPGQRLSTMDLRLALVFEPKVTFPISWGGVQKVSLRALTKRRAALSQAEELLETISDVLGISAMEREDILEYLAFLTTADMNLAKAQRPFAKEAKQIDRWMANLPARTNPWTGVRIGKIQPIVLSLDRPPEITFPNSLRAILALNGRLLVSAEWKREPVEKSVKMLKRAEGWFEVVKYLRNFMAVIRILLKEGDTTGEIPDKKAEQDKERANDERLRLQGGSGQTHGWMGFTVVCFSEDPED
jgi:type IV secretion system protein VirB4